MLSVSELKQYVYCPRIFYFLSVQPMRPPATGLMQRGRRLQEEFERLEPRRVLSRYGFGEARRHFSLAMTHPESGLTGQVDLLLEAPDQVAVVEFKASSAPLAENHRYQLGAYALLAERAFCKPCPSAFAIFVDRSEIEEIAIDEEQRRKVQKALADMRVLVQTAGFPAATPMRARCTNCEYRHFCGDVF
jgi:CRISPR-associated exonuclease Cas4